MTVTPIEMFGILNKKYRELKWSCLKVLKNETQRVKVKLRALYLGILRYSKMAWNGGLQKESYIYS